MDKSLFSRALAQHVPLDEPEINELLEVPPNPDMGDIAFPCFGLAKVLRKSPNDIAATLVSVLSSDLWEVSAAGGYLNFKLNREQALQSGLIQAMKDGISLEQSGAGRTLVIDFASPNIAKPISIGNLRSTILGNALSRMYEAKGWNVVRINHLGDWGSQFGKVLAAYKRWGNDEQIFKDPVKELLSIYVKFHTEVETDPTLLEDSREWFQKLEQRDEEALRLWKWFVGESTQAFMKTYNRLGIHFDHYWGESFYTDKIPPVIDKLRELRLLESSDGAEIVRFGDDLPPCIMIKSDGTTIYAVRDVATAVYRYEAYHFDEMIYVVGSEQILHFQQVFKVLQLMGHEWSSNCKHVPFGLLKIDGKKMSSRKGDVIFLEDVLNESVYRVKNIIEEKNPELEDRDAVAETVGVGAVVFHELKNQRIKEIDFSWDDVLNFDGESGPYVQYTHARISSLIKKAQFTPAQYLEMIDDDRSIDGVSGLEWQLWRELKRYDESVSRAVEKQEPFIVTRQLLSIAHCFNSLYNQQRILTDESDKRGRVLALVYHTGETLQHGLGLLGIGAPNRM
ncbi:arginine--tRNA ligase [Alicyclobacillus acidiphilus]|uniref:arginine--tRNA ligase n=1 Tax=Alicyclobacillus acidiphilus TaxID=182455 RepID=UPI000837A934|nr:arginine--tRNA ligase [Alicyclobacillus acidiphilus]